MSSGITEKSRLQTAVDKFAAKWLADTGEKPSRDTISDGTFSRRTDESFCLCFRPIAALINFAGLDCSLCGKPVTDETNEWYDEARRMRSTS